MKILRVIGFQDVERHALNSMVRLSVERRPSYTIWQEGMAAPDVLLIDGQHMDAYKTWATEPHQDKIIWVGENPPKNVHFHVMRPMQWMKVLELMDQVIAHTVQTQPLDIQLDSDPNAPIALSDFNVSGTGESATSKEAPILYIHADNTVGRAPDKRKRILIIDSNTTFRLYLKAVLSVGGEIVADESGDPDEALHMAQTSAYDSILIDSNLIGKDPLDVCKALVASAMTMRPGDTRISRPYIYLLSQNAGFFKKLQAKRAGANGVLIRPRNQEQLDALFNCVNRYAMT